MKITKLAVIILLATFIFFLIALAPATLLSKMLPENGGVQLNGLSGSVWRGHAAQVQYQRQNFGKLDWRLSPWVLFTGKVGGRFELEGVEMRADGYAKVNKNNDLWLADTNIRLNANNIPLTGDAAAIAASGIINAKVDELVFVDQTLDTINTRIAWQQAAVQAPIDLEIGDLVIDAKGDNGAATAVISTAQNSKIDINGTIDLAANGSYQSNIKIRAKPDTPENIRNYLTLIGEEDSNGARELVYNGVLFK